MWELAVTLDPAAKDPLFLQIARGISDDVRRGRLRPGQALPGSRTLARALAVHRNTVLAAYQELSAEGWITTAPAGGTFVSQALPEPAPKRFSERRALREAMPGRVAYELPPPVEVFDPTPKLGKGTLVLAGGIPDVRLVPVAALGRAYRRVLRAHGTEVLSYGDARGHPRLRDALAGMLSSLRGLCASPDYVLVTRGSQMALDLVARTLIAPGDVVVVEALGYRPAWAALRLAGAELHALPVDAQGLRTDALAELAARASVRAVYVTPHHHYPTTVVLSAGRRLELLALAERHRIAIIEDDYDFEFHYEGRPVLPLASADRLGSVVYVGTLSKILAPGLRLGFAVAPAPLAQRLTALRTLVDRQGDQAVECAVAELVEDGELQRHVSRVRRAYQSRRDALADALTRELGGALRFSPPIGGMALWTEIAPDIDVDAWAERAPGFGVVFHPGRRFAFDGKSRQAARLGFASLTEPELAEAARRLAAALPRSMLRRCDTSTGKARASRTR